MAGRNTVFPARAGMIRRMQPPSPDQPRIPRESGDDPDTSALVDMSAEYSPRERG